MEIKLDGKQNPKFRLIILGSKKVGKTSLLNQTINNFFRPEYYPTKDLIIYKKLYNFNPKPGEFDDFCYIEIIDTMAYDRSKNLKDFSEFFQVHLAKERDISKSNIATKIPENVLKTIRHEYLSGKDAAPTKGLFSTDKIMAYIFVFDYNDDDSLNDMLESYYQISSDEGIKIADENLKTVKCFICNKYPVMIDEVPLDIPYQEVVSTYMERDRRTADIVNKIQKRLIVKDAKKSNEAKEITFFTNCKYNLGVKNCFSSIFNKIKHKEDLWRKITFEPKDSKKEDEDKIEEDDQSGGFLCCKKSKAAIDNKNLEEKSIRNQSVQEKMNFRDDDEEGYDENVRVKPKNEHTNTQQLEEEKKEGGCTIF